MSCNSFLLSQLYHKYPGGRLIFPENMFFSISGSYKGTLFAKLITVKEAEDKKKDFKRQFIRRT